MIRTERGTWSPSATQAPRKHGGRIRFGSVDSAAARANPSKV